MAEGHCGEAHGAVVTRLDHLEREQQQTQQELDAHRANGGTGHVGRTEFDKLAGEVTAMRSLLIKAVVVVALAAGGGSTLAPTLLKLLGG